MIYPSSSEGSLCSKFGADHAQEKPLENFPGAILYLENGVEDEIRTRDPLLGIASLDSFPSGLGLILEISLRFCLSIMDY